MNELQKKELNILKIFLEICEKNNLKYFLACGTVLGAAKYKGFIPWDDDVDVCMPRGEYEKFLKVAKTELPEWCFLQNYKTDPAFPHSYSKLRDSRTTFIESGVAHLKINHGIYIDVFPLDGFPESDREIKALNFKKKLLIWQLYCCLKGKVNFKVCFRNFIFRFFGFHKRTAITLKKFDALVTKYSDKDSKILCNHGNWQGSLEYAPKWHYGNGILGEFEGLSVVLPEKFDDYLTQKYGNWRNDPPKDKQKSNHQVFLIDTNRPYTDFIN